MAIHLGPLEWTRVWSSHELGKMRWSLYATAKHPLVKLQEVQEADAILYPFVMSTGWGAQGFLRGRDECPIPWGVRFSGHEATTAETALEIVQATDHLVFVPALLAQRSVEQGLIKEIKIKTWPIVERTIYLSVRDDLVSRSLLQLIIGSLRERLL